MANDVLSTIDPCISSPLKATRAATVEMLQMIVDFNPHIFREYLIKQARTIPDSKNVSGLRAEAACPGLDAQYDGHGRSLGTQHRGLQVIMNTSVERWAERGAQYKHGRSLVPSTEAKLSLIPERRIRPTLTPIAKASAHAG